MKNQQTSFFIDDIYMAGFYRSEIRKKYKAELINVCNDFDEYFHRVTSQYANWPYLNVTFRYFEPYRFMDRYASDSETGAINFIVGQGIDDVQIKIIPSMHPLLNESVPEQKNCSKPIFRYSIQRKDLYFNLSYISEKLYERATWLQKMRTLHIGRDRPSLVEFLDDVTQKFLRYFKSEYGRLNIWAVNKPFHLLYEKAFIDNQIQNYQIRTEPEYGLKKEITHVDAISDRALQKELKSHRINYHIIIPFRSKHIHGYLDFFSGLQKIGYEESELIDFFTKRICFTIDNTFFFQKFTSNQCGINAIFDDYEDGILIIDSNRRILDINEAMEKFIGWDKKDVIGTYCKDLYHSCDFQGTPLCNSRKCPMLDLLSGYKTVTRQAVYTRSRSGEKRIAKSQYFLDRNRNGNIVYGVAVARNITKHVQLEEKLRHFEQLSCLGTFAAELAHEIRNPVTGVSSNAQFLYEESSLSHRDRTIAGEIVKGANLIENVVKKFLDLARPAKPYFAKENINEIIRESASVFQKKIDNAGIALDFSLTETIPEIWADGNLISQIFLNIFMNSIEAMEAGGRLAVKTCFVSNSFENSKTEKVVRVIIIDTGSGISEENLEKIFDPFFTTKANGTGLGLYTSYRILRDHNASITVKSEENQGTEICIDFKIED